MQINRGKMLRLTVIMSAEEMICQKKFLHPVSPMTLVVINMSFN